uniref:Uncharacterized protein n=1 Tax=Myoviridae sp. ctJ2i1 TaxID=2825079 RepID=A0A8S5V2B2_9CAUD|nr:MAG TPA: hypothetical protein [Myoviridae sp. ctJ2i1]
MAIFIYTAIKIILSPQHFKTPVKSYILAYFHIIYIWSDVFSYMYLVI